MRLPKDILINYALLVGNSSPDIDEIKKYSNDANCIIAVDGGANVLNEINIKPEIIVGDFDSIEEKLLKTLTTSGAKVIHKPDQDNNDLEKAFCSIPDNVDNVILIGFLGNRLDHTLANLFVAEKYLEKYRILFVDKTQDVYVLSPGRYDVDSKKWQLISIFTFDRVKNLSLKGFKYELEDYELLPSSLGLSNISLKNRTVIKFTKGNLILLLNK